MTGMDQQNIKGIKKHMQYVTRSAGIVLKSLFKRYKKMSAPLLSENQLLTFNGLHKMHPAEKI